MDILEQKVNELTEKGVPLMSVAGNMKNVKSHIIANKKTEKIVVLVMNKAGTKLSAYSVGLNEWEKAEADGLNIEEIMNNLTIVRAFGIRAPQKAKLQGNVFMEIELDSLSEYLL